MNIKRLLCLVLVIAAVGAVLAGCSTPKSTVTVNFVEDEDNDNKGIRNIVSKTVVVEGKDPSINTIIQALIDDGSVQAEFTEDEDGNKIIASFTIEEKSYAVTEDKSEDGTVTKIYRWYARVDGAAEDVQGLWSETKLKDGDTVTFRYAFWTPAPV